MNSYGKKFLNDNYKSKLMQLEEFTYQIKTTILKKSSQELLKIEDLNDTYYCHLNQVYLKDFEYLLLIMFFENDSMVCWIPMTILQEWPKSFQHNENCYQIDANVNFLIDNYLWK